MIKIFRTNNTDTSLVFFNKYYKLKNKSVEVTLKNGKKVYGEIVGFYKTGYHDDVPYIYKWHIMQEKDKIGFGNEIFGTIVGEMVFTKNILEIKCMEDNTIIKF